MDGIRRSAGIDWAKERHAVCIIDERGGVLARFEVEHSEAGLRELVSRLGGVECVAIERRAARAIPTRCASWHGPGSRSSGAAGRTACPTTRHATGPCSDSSLPRRRSPREPGLT
jgi:hypothetical protein